MISALALVALAGLARTPAYVPDTEAVLAPPNVGDGDRAQLVVDGWKRAACDETLPPAVRLRPRDRTIEVAVKAQASAKSRNCQQVMTRFTSVVELGTLPPGRWRVVMKDGLLEGALEVGEGAAAERSEELANVTALSVEEAAGGGWNAVISGVYANNCERLAEPRLTTGTHAFELVPVSTTRDGDDCGSAAVPFTERLALPSPGAPGRYLVHVRTRGGGALNEVFSVGDLDVIGHDGH